VVILMAEAPTMNTHRRVGKAQPKYDSCGSLKGAGGP
jgi:hypothetical protein